MHGSLPLTVRRGGDDKDGNGLHGRVLSTFLNELDGVVARESGPESAVLVLAACSEVEALDEALLRPGYALRLDCWLLFNLFYLVVCSTTFCWPSPPAATCNALSSNRCVACPAKQT